MMQSLLCEPERHPLFGPEVIHAFGATVVVAPHPDDESLGCGGVLSALAHARQPASVIVMTDGSRSHPNSRSHPAERLAALREEELISALHALGLPKTAAHFLRYVDCKLPSESSAAFEAAAIRVAELLSSLDAKTIFVPWRRDPHCDHVATWRILMTAVGKLRRSMRWFEYPIWAWTQYDGAAAPQAAEARAWRLDISSHLKKKHTAIVQHRSQMGELIRDDPEAFSLTPEMLRNFAVPWELFFEPADV